MAGAVLPGRDGLVYLTDVLYRLGWQATDRLALPEKNAEVVIPVPLSALAEARSMMGSCRPGHWPGGARSAAAADTSGSYGAKFRWLFCPGHGYPWRFHDDH